jgi:hypothetical protein
MAARKRTNSMYYINLPSCEKNPTREFYRNKCKPLQKEHPDIIYQLK